jgi:K+/H+ antiporter YhaU regulatory subunit KhtT
MTQMRKGISAQMTRSLAVPHAYVHMEVDVTNLVRLRESGIRDRGCSAVALRRDGRFMTDMTADTVLQAGDELYICGTIEAFRDLAL